MAKLSQQTRDAVRDGAIRSAAAVLALYDRDRAEPPALLDVGTGEGHWLDAAHDLWPGAQCCGVDLDAPERGATITRWDAEAGTPLPAFHADGEQKRWPLVLCLETAEHVSPAAGDHLVAELCRVSERLLWSAAIPGQGGDGHVNEQPPAYWNHRFNQHGFFLTDPFRMTLWGDERVEPWYRQNLLLAQPAILHSDGRPGGPIVTCPPPYLVHPVTWAHYRGVA